MPLVSPHSCHQTSLLAYLLRQQLPTLHALRGLLTAVAEPGLRRQQQLLLQTLQLQRPLPQQRLCPWLAVLAWGAL